MESESTTAKKSSNLLVVGVVIALLVLAAGFYIVNNSSKKASPSSSTTTAPNVTGRQEEGNNTADPNVKAFEVMSKSFSFSPAEIRVNKGDKVKITLNNTEGIHDFVIDELNIRTEQLSGGQKESVEFTADKVGTFEFYCSVGNHRQMGMVGKIIVQ